MHSSTDIYLVPAYNYIIIYQATVECALFTSDQLIQRTVNLSLAQPLHTAHLVHLGGQGSSRLLCTCCTCFYQKALIAAKRPRPAKSKKQCTALHCIGNGMNEQNKLGEGMNQ